jgi:hypothetical protein
MSGNYRLDRNNKATLDQKLEAYRSSARLVKAAAPALGAMLAGVYAVDVQAQGCTGGTMNGTVCHQLVNVQLNNSSSYLTVDFDGDGDREARVGVQISGGFILNDLAASDALLSFIRDPVDVGGASPYARVLNPTSAPSTYNIQTGNPNWTTRDPFITRVGQTFDIWKNPNRNAYVGVLLQMGGATNYFGWINLQVNAQQDITVISTAYNTTQNASLVAGNTGLPVELTTFTAQAGDRSVVLNWQTATETNNAGFEIQHRQHDSQAAWEALDFVAGHGSTLEAQPYSYQAKDLLPGRHTFRLKQIDFDGTFAYSETVEVEVEVPGTHLLSAAYPNPFNPQARFTLSVAATQQVRIEVFDLMGRALGVLHDGELDGGSTHTFSIDGSDWPSGQYVYRVAGETFNDSKQVSLLK